MQKLPNPHLDCGPIWARSVCVLALALAVSGCRCEADEIEPDVPTAKPDPQRRCQGAKPGSHFTIRAKTDGTPLSAEDAERERPMPFAVELGNAVVFEQGFAVSYTRGDGRQTQAGVALVDADVGQGELIDLTQLVGDASPPRVVALDQQVIAAVANNDAAGGALQLVAVRRGAEPQWGGELDMGVDDSPAFDLVLSAGAHPSGAVVWDEWDRGQNVGYIALSTFELDQLGSPTPAKRVTPDGVDAESPRLAQRADGFWLAWQALGRKPGADEAPPDEELEDPSVLQLSPSWIELLRLEADGTALGDPIRVTPQDGFVQGFDIVAGHGGSLMAVWRDAKSSPGTRGGVVRIARVSPDGSVSAEFVEDQDVGAGVPLFLFDHDPRDGAPHGWLVLDAFSGQTRFSGLSPVGKQLELLETDHTVGVGSLLAAHGGRLLLAQPRGRDSVLSAIRCGDGTPKPAPDPSSEAPKEAAQSED